MAANSPVGEVDKYLLKTTDANENEYQTDLARGKLAVNPMATYQQVDTASRAVSALILNTYVDTILVTNISVNEKLAE